MKLKMFSVFDAKASAFITPFFLPESGMAVRSFADCINQDGHAFNAHPEDYTLFELGNFDSKTSEVMVLDTPKSLGIGVEYMDNDHVQPRNLKERLDQLYAWCDEMDETIGKLSKSAELKVPFDIPCDLSNATSADIDEVKNNA